ncbi:MAG: T9SS type A sorting domain-containing protein [Bacteroidales bacterium]|nr:T9SS type A sorting domain-containing protein [Bacteroidales bacterium]
MKKITLSLLLTMLVVMTTMAQPCKVTKSDYNSIELSFAVDELTVDEAILFGETFQQIRMPGFMTQSEAGLPALPSMVKMIEIPLGTGLHYTVLSIACDTIDAVEIGLTYPVVPFQPSRSKSDTTETSLTINRAAYASNRFLGDSTIVLEEVGVARSSNLARVIYNPIQWNPATNQLVVVKSITVSIEQSQADIEGTRRMQRLHYSPAFNCGVDVINTLGSKDNHTNAPLRYTIVAHSQFRGALDEFTAWKRRKGFIVDLMYTDDPAVGNTTASIHAYLQGLYDNATPESPAPTYVLLVGDVAQVPAFYVTSINEHHYSDLNYCLWTAGDNIPDCYYGRFSAQNLSQLEPQISKTLMYEQYTFPDDSYLDNAALIAGVDRAVSNDWAYRYADPTMDYVAQNYVNTSNGFQTLHYYKNNTNFAPTGITVTGSSNNNSAYQELINLYNRGCGWVNYSAHGDIQEWSRPILTNNNVHSLTNVNKPMVMIGNCCLTNSFQIDECFGEALLRQGNNGGAVAYIGASNSSYWSEDYYWAVGLRNSVSNTVVTDYDSNNMGMYDHLFHQHGEDYTQWYTTLGGMMFIGNMAVESSTSNRKVYYWQIYHLMGDPSLMPYYRGRANDILADIPEAIFVGATSLSFTTLPYAYVAFNGPDSTLKAAAFADATGNVELTFAAIPEPATYEVVITAQGFKPRIERVEAIGNGPFVAVKGMTIDGEIAAGNTISFNIDIANIGVEVANDVSIEFRSLDNRVQIGTTGRIALNSSMEAGEQRTLTAQCTGHVWENVSDQSDLAIRVLLYWRGGDFRSSKRTFYFTANAGQIKVQQYVMNSNFEQNDTAFLVVTNKNIGHAALRHATLTLLSLDPGLTVIEPTNSIADIAPDSTFTKTYLLVKSDTALNNRTIPILQYVDNGSVTTIDTISLTIGNPKATITFEDDSWQELAWENNDNPWEITTSNVFAGMRSLRSKAWGNSGGNTSSTISIEWTSTMDDSITFYRNVSSEYNYDYFNFYIDGELMDQASGIGNSWTRISLPVSAGTHLFTFSYDKDISVNNGSDCAWIDNLTLPYSGTTYNYLVDTVCKGAIYQFGDSLLNTEPLTVSQVQLQDTTETSIDFLTLIIAEEASLAVSSDVEGSIKAGEAARLVASGTTHYVWSNGESGSTIDVYPTETTTYTVVGSNGGCTDTASITVVVDGSLAVDHPQAFDATIFPNPTSQQVNIHSNGMRCATVSDITGRTILRQQCEDRCQIDVSTWSNGIYFVQIIAADGKRAVKKFVKK